MAVRLLSAGLQQRHIVAKHLQRPVAALANILGERGRNRGRNRDSSRLGSDTSTFLLPGAILAAFSAIASVAHTEEKKNELHQSLTADQCYKLCHGILEIIRSVYELPHHGAPVTSSASAAAASKANSQLPQVGLWYRSDKTPVDPSAGYEIMLRGVINMHTVGDPALDRILLDGIAHAQGKSVSTGQDSGAVGENSRTGEAWARAYHRAAAVIAVCALLLPIYPGACSILLQDLRNMLLGHGTEEERRGAASDLVQSATPDRPRVYGVVPHGGKYAGPVQTLGTLMDAFLDKQAGGRFVLHLEHGGGMLCIDTSDIQSNGDGIVQIVWKPFPKATAQAHGSASASASASTGGPHTASSTTPTDAAAITGVKPCDVIALNLVHAAMARMYRSSSVLTLRVPWLDVERLSHIAVSEGLGPGKASTDTLTALGLHYGLDAHGKLLYSDSMQPVIPEIPLVLQAAAAAQGLLQVRPQAGRFTALSKAPLPPAGSGLAGTASAGKAGQTAHAVSADDEDDEEDVDLPGGSYGGGGLGSGQGGPGAVGQARSKLDPRKTPKKFLRSMGIQIFAPSSKASGSSSSGSSSSSSSSSSASSAPLDWQDLAGADETRKEVEDGVLLPMQFPELYAKITADTRARTEANTHGAFLFVGPPGTGKTTTARIIASKAKRPLVVLNFENIGSSFYAATENNLARVLEAVSCIEGAVLFVDEAESMFPSRYSSDGGGGSGGEAPGGSGGTGGGHIAQAIGHKLLSQMLKFLEGMQGGARNSIIFASNRARDLDPALLSRCAATVSFELPDGTQREAIWARYAKHLGKVDTQTLVKESEGMTGRDIKRIAEVAERRHLAALLRRDPAALAAAGLTSSPHRDGDVGSNSDGDASAGAVSASVRVSPPPVSVYSEVLEERAEGVLSLGGAAEGSSAFRRKRRQAKGMQWTRGPKKEDAAAAPETRKSATEVLPSPQVPSPSPSRAPPAFFQRPASPAGSSPQSSSSPTPHMPTEPASPAAAAQSSVQPENGHGHSSPAGAEAGRATTEAIDGSKKKRKQLHTHPGLPKDIEV